MHEPSGSSRHNSNADSGEDSEMAEGRRRLGTIAGDPGPYGMLHAPNESVVVFVAHDGGAVQSANGSTRVSPQANKPKKSTADFKTIRHIGDGAFGQVRLATDL